MMKKVCFSGLAIAITAFLADMAIEGVLLKQPPGVAAAICLLAVCFFVASAVLAVAWEK